MSDKYYQKNWDFNDIFEEFQLGRTKDEDIKNRRFITDWIWKQYSKTIKPKTKKVKKWKYSRKELAEKIYKVLITLFESQARQKVELHEIKLELLATQPQPIKEEECPACNNPLSKYIHTCKNHNKLNKELKQSTPSPQEESKDIEFEEIEEIEGTDVGIGTVFGAEGEKINSLIRNQKKIIDYINSKEKL